MIFNTDLLEEQLLAAGIPASTRAGIDSEGEPDVVIQWNATATAQQITDGNAIAAAHNAAGLTVRQGGMAALRNYLDNNMDDLKYGDYFFKLQKKLHDFWRPPRPNLTDRYTATIVGLKGDMATDTNHAAMWNTFLDFVQVEYGATVTAGEIVINTTVPLPQQAAQLRVVIQAARTFMIEGLAMVNMLLANRILS